MILLVDTNPVLEQRLKGDSFPKGARARATEKQTTPAGYGAHMAQFAGSINEDSRLMAFFGGDVGERYKKFIEAEGIHIVAKTIRDETKERLILEEKNRKTIIETKDPRLTREDMVDFYDRFLNEAASVDAVVIAESRDADEADEMKLPLVRYARRQSKPVIILAKEADDVEEMKEAKPFGLVVDRDVLAKKMNKPIHFLGEIVSALDVLYGGEIPLILVTGSERGSILCARGSYYFAKNEEKSGAFDAHYAAVALAVGIVRKYDAPTMLKLAHGAASTEGDADFADLKGRMNKIDVQQMEV